LLRGGGGEEGSSLLNDRTLPDTTSGEAEKRGCPTREKFETKKKKTIVRGGHLTLGEPPIFQKRPRST